MKNILYLLLSVIVFVACSSGDEFSVLNQDIDSGGIGGSSGSGGMNNSGGSLVGGSSGSVIDSGPDTIETDGDSPDQISTESGCSFGAKRCSNRIVEVCGQDGQWTFQANCATDCDETSQDCNNFWCCQTNDSGCHCTTQSTMCKLTETKPCSETYCCIARKFANELEECRCLSKDQTDSYYEAWNLDIPEVFSCTDFMNLYNKNGPGDKYYSQLDDCINK